jgi:phosphopantetheinyl transferase
MPPTELIFNPLPASFLSLTENLFNTSKPAIAILPLCAITQPATENTLEWLHHHEKTQLEKFSFEKRYCEWLGGRICAKQSLRTFLQNKRQHENLIPKHIQYYTQSEESGRPFFSASNEPGLNFPELSISHSNEYAAALTSSTACGIDIQFSAQNLLRVQEKFCTTEESHILKHELPALSPLLHLTLIWSAKEAVKKMLSPGGIPGFQELQLCKLEPQNSKDSILNFSSTKTNHLIPVSTTMTKDSYAIAICCAATAKTNVA